MTLISPLPLPDYCYHTGKLKIVLDHSNPNTEFLAPRHLYSWVLISSKLWAGGQKRGSRLLCQKIHHCYFPPRLHAFSFLLSCSGAFALPSLHSHRTSLHRGTDWAANFVRAGNHQPARVASPSEACFLSRGVSCAVFVSKLDCITSCLSIAC